MNPKCVLEMRLTIPDEGLSLRVEKDFSDVYLAAANKSVVGEDFKYLALNLAEAFDRKREAQKKTG